MEHFLTVIRAAYVARFAFTCLSYCPNASATTTAPHIDFSMYANTAASPAWPFSLVSHISLARDAVITLDQALLIAAAL